MPRRRRALLYDPYLVTLGGGEKYLLAIAACLDGEFQVTVAAPILPDAEAMVAAGFPTDFRCERLAEWRVPLASLRYDLLVYVSNDPPYPSLARRSFLVAQFPFVGLGASMTRRLASRIGLARYSCIAYSEFARTWIRSRWSRDAVVVSPPVELGSYDSTVKRREILAVGRFFPEQHSKRQDVLVESFRQLPVSVHTDWHLTLAGGDDGRPESRRFLEHVRELAEGANVAIETSVPAQRLRELYQRASLFWHATGFGRPPDAPERAEHFGISTVEAMSWGAVPLVYDDGGQREIVSDAVGIRWHTVEELIEHTVALSKDPGRLARMAEAAHDASMRYGEDTFCTRIRGAMMTEAGA